MYKDTTDNADALIIEEGTPAAAPSTETPPSRLRILLTSLAVGLGFQYLWLLVTLTKEHGSFRRAMSEQIAAEMTRIFQKAVEGNPSAKDPLVDRVKAHAQSYAAVEYWKFIALQSVVIAKYIAFFVVIISFRYSLRVLFPEPVADRLLLPGIMFSCILLLVLVLPRSGFLLFATLSAQQKLSPEKAQQFANRISFFAKFFHRWPFICAVVYFIWFLSLQPSILIDGLRPNRELPFVALPLTLMVVVVIWLISRVRQLVNYFFNRIRSINGAESVIAVNLLSLVEILRTSHNIVSETLRRRSVIAVLETIATHFETYLPRQIVGNTLSAAPLKLELGKIGGGVRALKRDVAIPISDSWDEELRKKLSDFLLKFLSLNWAALPTAEIEKISTNTILSRTLLFVRSILIAAIPGILLAILQSTPFRLTDQRAEIALIVAVAWFALSIVFRLDPEFTAKTQALKDIQDVVSLNPK